jgi:hypothetical protein
MSKRPMAPAAGNRRGAHAGRTARAAARPAHGDTVPQPGFTYRQRFHGRHAEYLWCSRCTRAFPTGAYRQVGSVRRCPYNGCSGHSILDARDWVAVRSSHADYPSAPQPGTEYAFAAAPRPQGRPRAFA